MPDSYILACGGLFHLYFVGPFSSMEAAIEYGDRHIDTVWEIVLLQSAS